MNRTNHLEKHLLLRCYSSEAQALEVLASRYSASGELPQLVLTPTGAPAAAAAAAATTSLLAVDAPKATRTPRTRHELKQYIRTTVANQRKLAKKVQRHRSAKRFPLDRMRARYQIPVFEEFAGIARLWQAYMLELLFPGGAVPSLAMLLPKLASADYTGCLVTVTRARNPHLVGVRGTVVWDAQHLFVICVPAGASAREWTEEPAVAGATRERTEEPADALAVSAAAQVGGLRVIPKQGCIFSFDVLLDPAHDDCIGFSIIGSRFEFRSVDRSAKKFKNHKVDDIV
jgi:ribonuclease P protein subunit POP4